MSAQIKTEEKYFTLLFAAEYPETKSIIALTMKKVRALFTVHGIVSYPHCFCAGLFEKSTSAWSVPVNSCFTRGNTFPVESSFFSILSCLSLIMI